MDGTCKHDGTATILMDNGFRWFRSIGCWGLRYSRDKQPDVHKINRTATALQEAGFTVAIEIDRSHRSPEQVEAGRIASQSQRVKALDAKAMRKRRIADQAWDKEAAASAAVPPGGEPVKIGHWSFSA